MPLAKEKVGRRGPGQSSEGQLGVTSPPHRGPFPVLAVYQMLRVHSTGTSGSSHRPMLWCSGSWGSNMLLTR